MGSGGETGKKPGTAELPDIPMRDFPMIHVGENTVSVRENQIRLAVKVHMSFGKGTSRSEFNGKIVDKVVFHKAGPSAPGYVQFLMKPNFYLVDPQPEMREEIERSLVELLKLPFTQAEEPVMKLFASQVCEDIGISVTEP